MNQIIEQMLKQYTTNTIHEKMNGIKEIVQEIVLCGLSRAGFFKTATFYGGTALRIFYGLDRFSEDLDFSLKAPDPSFNLNDYLSVLDREARAYGLNFKAELKSKSIDSAIKSAFIKGSTKEHMLMFYADEHLAHSFVSSELIKVKFELDTNPPEFATYETKYRFLPVPYEITMYDMPSLFAGKIHAILCRAWKNRIKGRDLYDYVFYISKATNLNLAHLSARLAQTGLILKEDELTIKDVKQMLCKRFESVDYSQAKQDVIPFIKNTGALDVWSADFFCQITDHLGI